MPQTLLAEQKTTHHKTLPGNDFATLPECRLTSLQRKITDRSPENAQHRL